MILIEKNIQQILFIRIFPQPNIPIVNVMKVIKKQHFTNKRYIQNQQVQTEPQQSYCLSHIIPYRKKHPWQSSYNQAYQIIELIYIHPPPKAIRKTFLQRSLIPLAKPAWPIYIYKQKPEYGTYNWWHYCQPQILLPSIPKCFHPKHIHSPQPSILSISDALALDKRPPRNTP